MERRSGGNDRWKIAFTQYYVVLLVRYVSIYPLQLPQIRYLLKMLSNVFHFDRNLVEKLIVEYLDFSYDNLRLTGVGYFIFIIIIIQTASAT